MDGGEDAGERTEEVVEDLGAKVATLANEKRKRKKKGKAIDCKHSRGERGGVTYGKGTQLAGSALPPNGDNLGHLARDAEGAGAGLQEGHGIHADEVVGEEGGGGESEGADEGGGQDAAALVAEDEDGDDDVLGGDEGGLAVGAEGEAAAGAVGEGDGVGGRLDDVGEDGEAGA